MLESIIDFDKQLFLYLNSKHSVFFDDIMWFVSGQLIWLPWFLFLIFLIFRHFRLQGFYVLISVAIVVALCDQLSVHLFKNVFERLRPCHDIELKGLVHIVKNKCGGSFGFVSSHAANTFGVACFLALLFKRKWLFYILLFWAILVSYSRIYLGVHYPGDVLGGAILGAIIGIFFYKVYCWVLKKMTNIKTEQCN